MKKTRFITGKMPVLEAISSGQPIEKIFIRKGYSGKGIQDIIETASNQGIPIHLVPKEKIKRLLGLNKPGNEINHQGVVALSAQIRYYDFEDIVSFQFEQGKLPFICILDRVTDVRNLGAIARSALAFGVHALVIPYKESAEINEFAIKSSAGALEKIPVCRVKSLAKTIEKLKLHGIHILAADMDGVQLNEVDINEQPVALIMGSEGEGIDPGLVKLCDSKVSIPISSEIESLNVSVAAAILFYEIAKNR